jgi:DNA-binding transcriptional regulator PaaX
MKKSKIGKDLLRYLALGGVLTLAMLSPVGGHKVLKGLLKQLKYKIDQLRFSAYYLKKRGLIEFVKEDGKGVTMKITDNGRKYLKTFDIENMTLNKPAQWDKKWRLVIFDVPEKHKNAREALRRKLKDLDFVRLQDSVWVTPYPCDDEIRFIREVFNIPFNVDVIVVNNLKHHEIRLKKYFNLV